MTYTITNQCIACDRCRTVCPTGAIQQEGLYYWINAEHCNNCEDYYGVPRCWASCPTNEGCVPVAALAANSLQPLRSDHLSDYWKNWFATYNRLLTNLQRNQKTDTWEQWFDLYSQKLSQVLAKHCSQFIEVQP